MRKTNIHFYFDDDGVLHQWNNFKLEKPESFVEMSPQEQADFLHDEIYRHLLAPGYFLNLPVQQNMVDLVTALHNQGYDVKILSCSINQDTDSQKYVSLSKCLPWIDKDDIILIPDGCGTRKAEYIPTKNDGINILIDDHTPNCKAFEEYGYHAIKCKNDVNSKGGSWSGNFVYYDNLDASLQSIYSIIATYKLLYTDVLTPELLAYEIEKFMQVNNSKTARTYPEGKLINLIKHSRTQDLLSLIQSIQQSDTTSMANKRLADELMRHLHQFAA